MLLDINPGQNNGKTDKEQTDMIKNCLTISKGN